MKFFASSTPSTADSQAVCTLLWKTLKVGGVPRVAEIALFTADVAALTAFYERLLGRAPDSRSESHASFDLGGTTLFIHVAGADAPGGAPNRDHVAFALDADAAAERMRATGNAVLGPQDFYWGRAAYVDDPDGRAVELQPDS